MSIVKNRSIHSYVLLRTVALLLVRGFSPVLLVRLTCLRTVRLVGRGVDGTREEHKRFMTGCIMTPLSVRLGTTQALLSRVRVTERRGSSRVPVTQIARFRPTSVGLKTLVSQFFPPLFRRGRGKLTRI